MRISLWNSGTLQEVSRQASASLSVETRGCEAIDLTPTLENWLHSLGVRDGALTLFCRHTSASLTVQENADPRVQSDLIDALEALAPQSRDWRHAQEGPDDMPAHVKTSLTDASLTVPDGLLEHRCHPHRRDVRLHFLGS
ncbi:MAG: secondary thiamine-phosphate synthase enzyme YjbQ [Kiloniellales bacterium]